MEHYLAGMQKVKKHIEGEEVIHRADGADEDHEVANQADVPMLGFAHVSFVHVVGGDGDLRHVVKKVVEQNLSGEHGQEFKKQGSSGHAEHVAEVRAGAHQKIFHDVAEGLAAFDDSVVKHIQTRFQQDDVSSVAGNVHRGGNGDADVGGVQRRGIVDAIAHVADHVAAVLESQDDAVFLGRRDTGKNRGLLGHMGQGAIAHALDFLAEHNLAGIQSHPDADVAGDQNTVPGNDLHLLPTTAQANYGF